MSQSSNAKSPRAVAATQRYALSSDLARACLPSGLRDGAHWRLAWVNSICLLFLTVGLAGLKPPRVIQRPFSPTEEPVMVEFTPPPESPKMEPLVVTEAPVGTQEVSERAPQVVGVVAAAEASLVAFAVPVEGAVAVADPARWTPPPALPAAPVAPTPQPTRFDPGATAGAADAGSYPPPQYPAYALRNHYEGTVTIALTVAPSGAVTRAEVLKTSGFTVLDEAALNVVKNRWRFPPGTARSYYWPCEFRLE